VVYLSTMKILAKISQNKAQTAIEYMLLLGIVTAIVLIGFKKFLPQVQESSNLMYNRAAIGIMGDAPKCGDGTCNHDERKSKRCKIDCL